MLDPDADAAPRDSEPETPGVPMPGPPPTPRPGAGEDLAWFIANSDRRYRVVRSAGMSVAQRLVTVSGDERVATMRCPTPDVDTDEAAAEAFASGALSWLVSLSVSEVPEGDVAWFASRPERAHRIRPSLPAEIQGRPAAMWGTIVARVDGRLLRLCVDEATLPRGDRGEQGLRTILRARAASLASGAALALERAPAEAVAALSIPPKPAKPTRTVHNRLGRIPETRFERLRRLYRTPGRPARPPKPKDPYDAMPARAPVERWHDRLVVRAAARSWPCISLERAVEVARAMGQAHGCLPMRSHDARRFCAEADNDDGGLGMSALKAYGLLVTDASGMARLSGVAQDILEGDPAYAPAALAKAAASPAAFRRILDDFGPAPSLDELLGTPVTGGMDDAEVEAMRDRFLATMAFAAPVEAPISTTG